MEIRKTEVFAAWFRGLRDRMARARIDMRIKRLETGNFGDAKSVGDSVHELRIHHGPGYRVYFTAREAVVIILLCGGDKSSQERDIERAKSLAGDL